MRSKNKITKAQIQKMYDFIQGVAFKDRRKNSTLKVFYHIDTPKDVYVSYLTYGVEPDNSIYSEKLIECIKPDGSVMDCSNQFDNLKQKMEFNSGLIEIDLDSKGNIIIL